MEDLSRRLQEIPKRLQVARLAANLSAAELSRLARKSQGYCALIEAGRKPNSEVRTLAWFAKVLGLSLDWLLLGRGSDPDPEEVRKAVEEARLELELDKIEAERQAERAARLQARKKPRPSRRPGSRLRGEGKPSSSRRPTIGTDRKPGLSKARGGERGVA